ncbi:MAG TPA: squalene/phytoene synthase family protein [Allosphingosinicella sp.]|jgi:phytoene synthase
MAELDRDRFLALSYVSPRARPAVEALWRLDATLGAVLTSGRDPLISQIKLAWWRDALEGLGSGRPPAEPALEAVATHVLPLGVSGAELAEMEGGWTLLLTPDPLTPDELARYASERGGRLFGFTARALGGEVSDVVRAGGEAWALIDLARHSGSEVDAQAAIAAARERGMGKWPSRLRPVGMLAALAARDAERGVGNWEEPGAPPRMLRMLRHRLTGR